MWILRNQLEPFNYFREWTAIGPRMTFHRHEARVFSSQFDAILESTRHYGLTCCEPIEFAA